MAIDDDLDPGEIESVDPADPLFDPDQEVDLGELYKTEVLKFFDAPMSSHSSSDVISFVDLTRRFYGAERDTSDLGLNDAINDYFNFKGTFTEEWQKELFRAEAIVETHEVLDKEDFLAYNVQINLLGIDEHELATFQRIYIKDKGGLNPPVLDHVPEEEPKPSVAFRSLESFWYNVCFQLCSAYDASLRPDSPNRVKKAVRYLQEYGKLVDKVGTLELRLGQQAELNIMPNLGLSTGSDKLARIRTYVRLLEHCADNRHSMRSIQDSLLMPLALGYVVTYLDNPHWVCQVLNGRDGAPCAVTGADMATPSNIHGGAGDLEHSIQSYSYYTSEVKLLRSSMPAIIQEMQTRDSQTQITLTDFGVGMPKFEEVLNGFRHAQYSFDSLHLIDSDTARLSEAATALNTWLQDKDLSTEFDFYAKAFEDLQQTAHMLAPENLGLTSCTGGTLGNHEPAPFFSHLRQTGSQFYLLGVYCLNEHNEEDIIAQYDTPETREFVKQNTMLNTLIQTDTLEDETRCSYHTELRHEDWSDDYGEGFEDVGVLVAFYKAKEYLDDGFREYKTDDVLYVCRSYKFTEQQVRLLAEQNKYNVLNNNQPYKNDSNDGVSLFLLENTKPIELPRDSLD